jgi:hypothetical protein
MVLSRPNAVSSYSPVRVARRACPACQAILCQTGVVQTGLTSSLQLLVLFRIEFIFIYFLFSSFHVTFDTTF